MRPKTGQIPASPSCVYRLTPRQSSGLPLQRRLPPQIHFAARSLLLGESALNEAQLSERRTSCFRHEESRLLHAFDYAHRSSGRKENQHRNMG